MLLIRFWWFGSATAVFIGLAVSVIGSVALFRPALADRVMTMDAATKQQALAFLRYGVPLVAANALYVMVADPTVKAAEYDLFALLAESLGKDYATPENQEMMKKYVEAFAAGPNRLNLTPIAGGGM